MLNQNRFQNRLLRRSRGFTLVEVLTVVFIVGIIAGLITVNSGGDSKSELNLQAKRVVGLIDAARDESAIIGIPLGLKLSESDNSYSFKSFENLWRDYEVSLFRQRQLPELFKLKILNKQKDNPSGSNEDDDEESDQVPDIVITPDGLISPFVLKLELGQDSLFIKTNRNLKVILSETNELSE